MRYQVTLVYDASVSKVVEVVAPNREVAIERARDKVLRGHVEDHYTLDTDRPASIDAQVVARRRGEKQDTIRRWETVTKAGHTLSVFYNLDTGLLVVDVVHKNGTGGNEVVRQTLDDKRLLRHVEEG